MAQVPVRSDRLAIFRHSQRKTIMAARSHESVALIQYQMILDCALLVLLLLLVSLLPGSLAIVRICTVAAAAAQATAMMIFIPAVREIILSPVKGCAPVPHVVMGTC